MIFFDTFKHPYIIVNKYFVFPSISLVEFRIEEAKKIYNILLENFPDFNNDFKILLQDQIIGQKKYFSFVKIENIKEKKYALELKILASYAGGAQSNEILGNKLQNYSPSFKTDRLYFFLLLYMINDYKLNSDYSIEDINVKTLNIIKNYKIPYEDTKIEPWTVNLFDDIDFTNLLEIIQNKIPYEWKAKIWKKPFSIEKTTLALNLIHIKQYDFIKEDFGEFVFLLDLLDNKKLEEYRNINFEIFFSQWELVKCISKNGNLHWAFKKIPFI